MTVNSAPRLGTVLRGIFADNAATMRDLEDAVRSDAPDAVHQYRVRLRRIRSVLSAFRDEMDAVASAAGLDLPTLAARLRDLAGAFGHARDAEVNGQLVAGRLPTDDDAAAEARALLTDAAERAYERYRREALDLLDAAGPRTLNAVLEALGAAVAEAAAQSATDAEDRSGEDAGSVADDASVALARTVERQAEKVLRLAKKAKRAAPEDAATALHEVRKEAKRLRYTVEEVTAHAVDLTPELVEVVDAAHAVQEHLGAHHDSVGLAEFTRTTVEHAIGASGTDADAGHGDRAGRHASAALRAGMVAGAELAVQQRALRKYRKARRALRVALRP